MKKHGIELVCFDLNKTLIHETTWYNLNLALGMTAEEDQKYLDQYNEGKISYSEWTRILLDIFKSRGKAHKDAILKSVLSYTYKEGAKDIINYLKDQGYKVALISGSLDLVVDQVAKELGIEMAQSNHSFSFDEQGNLIDISVVERDDEAKLKHLEGFCRELGIQITQCACVGDGDNDIKLFEKTQHGITFVGSKIQSSAWKTIASLSEIKEIL